MSETTTVDLKDKLSLFHVSTHPYKLVDDTSILVDVLIPKKLLNGESDRKSKRPLILRIHAGGLTAGKSDFMPWFTAWTLELALKYDTIVINPDYRLLPEATAEEMLDDIDDLWKWISDDLETAVQQRKLCEEISIDLDTLFVHGESAGGYIAIQAALAHFNPTSKPKIRVTTVPQLVHLRFFASVSSTPNRAIVSNAEMDSPRVPFAFALIQRGRLLEVMGTDRDPTPGKRRLHPEDRIADGIKLPPAMFIHGSDDSVVPVVGTEKFVELVRKHKAVQGLAEGKDEKEVLKLVVQPGEHALDFNLHMDSEDWLKESIAFVEEHWLN